MCLYVEFAPLTVPPVSMWTGDRVHRKYIQNQGVASLTMVTLASLGDTISFSPLSLFLEPLEIICMCVSVFDLTLFAYSSDGIYTLGRKTILIF